MTLRAWADNVLSFFFFDDHGVPTFCTCLVNSLVKHEAALEVLNSGAMEPSVEFAVHIYFAKCKIFLASGALVRGASGNVLSSHGFQTMT